MNILITGAGGFIGRYLVDRLGKTHAVHGVYSKPNPANKSNSICLDLLDSSLVEKKFTDFSKGIQIDVLINLAASLASVHDTDNINLLRKNIIITENVVNIAKILKPSKIVNFSSMAVYPNVDGLFSEESLPGPERNPDCIYGLSKYCSEVLFDFLLRDTGVNILHLRVAQVYGEGMREDRIIPVMLKELRENNEITVYGDGERTSNFIEINKLVMIVEQLLESDVSDVYNIGDENISYSELALRLIREHGNENSSVTKVANGRREKFVLDTSKYVATLQL